MKFKFNPELPCSLAFVFALLTTNVTAQGELLTTWGNAQYVNFSVGDNYDFLGHTVTLVSCHSNYSEIQVDDQQVKLFMARRALPTVINGVRIFLADTRPVAEMTTTKSNGNVHAALKKDALLCLSDPSNPLLDPSEYEFPISREDGCTWTMEESSHMFAYLRPVRAHEGIDIDMSDARGHKLHALLAPENGTVREILLREGGNIEARILLESENDPELSYSYSHVNRHHLLVKPGDQVRKGQMIGYIWGDFRWGHLHFALRKYNYSEDESTGYGDFEYLLNCFPQMYELWTGSLSLEPKTHSMGTFQFAGQYWTRGNKQHLDQFDDIVGYGWKLGDWCAAGRVDTSLSDEGLKPGQSARLARIMQPESMHPARNPNDYIDFEVNVSNGKYLVQAEVGDIYAPTWQQFEFEGIDAGTYDLNKTVAWTPAVVVSVKDGKLTVRTFFKDSTTPAGIRELSFTKTSM